MSSFARAVVAIALVVLGIGTLSGSAPTWPDDTVYGIAAFAVAGLWLAAALEVQETPLIAAVADAGLVALSAIRAGAYTADLLRTADGAYLAPVGAWAIVLLLSARPMSHHHHVP